MRTTNYKSFLIILTLTYLPVLFACPADEDYGTYCSPGAIDTRTTSNYSQSQNPFLSPSWSHPISVNVCDYNSECNPWLADNGKKLFFIAIDCNGPARPGHIGLWDIYMAEWDSVYNRWGTPVNLGPNVNTPQGERRPSTFPDGDTLFFSRSGSIYVSIWDGNNWTLALPLPAPVNTQFGEKDPAISFDRQRLYFSSNRMGNGDDDIYVAERIGTVFEWGPVHNIGSPVNTSFNEVRPFESADGSKLYFSDFGDEGGFARPGGFGGADLWVSTWTGNSWGEPVNPGPPINTDLTLCSAWLSPQSDLLYTGSEAFEGSQGEEDIWVAYLDSFPAPATPPNPSVRWQQSGDLEGAWNVYCLAQGQDGDLYAGTLSTLGNKLRGLVYKSTDGGVSWNPTDTLPGAMIVYSLLAAEDGSIYAGTFPNGDVFRTTDEGNTWSPTANLPRATAVRALFQTRNGRILAGTSPTVNDTGYIYSTPNSGSSWNPLGPIPGITNGVFSILEAEDLILYAGGWSRPRRIFRSTTGGTTWTPLTNFPFPQNREICVHRLTQTTDGTLWLTGWIHAQGGYVLNSTNGGATWDTTGRIMSGTVHAVRVYALEEDTNGNLLIGFQPGPDSVVFYSSDGGATWHNTGVLAGAHEVLCLLKAAGGTIYAGTTPNGDVFKYTPAGIRESNAPNSGDYNLLQNSPNPSGKTTAIRFHLPFTTLTTLNIYTISGQLIRSLINECKSGGDYTIYWDGKDRSGKSVQSGVYFYRLETANFSITKKLILVR